jgi:hypothetical protein
LAFPFLTIIPLYLAAALFHGLVRQDGEFSSMALWPLGSASTSDAAEHERDPAPDEEPS